MLSATDAGSLPVLAPRRRNVTTDTELAALDMIASGLATGSIPMAVGQVPDGRDPVILYVNDAFLHMTGHRRPDVLGRPCNFLNGPETAPDSSHGLFQALRDNTPFDDELLHYRRDGTPFWNSVTVTPLREADGSPGSFLIIMRDVSQRRRADQQLAARADRLYELAMSDPLTGIANRRSFDAALEREWWQATHARGHVTLALLDIDHFKIYNDRLGHPAGDDCLRTVAKLLGGVLRQSTDLLARYGGEEFAILLPDTDADDAAQVARRLARAIDAAAIVHPGGRNGLLSISGGILSVRPAQFAGGTKNFVVMTDRALYTAKSAGRGHIHQTRIS